MDLSVVIVNYNVRQFLENALGSIQRAMEGLQGEIFVVDNASDDGSVEMVRDAFPDVCLIENKENIGFARANNLALTRARGRFLLLINPDTVVQEDTFRVMIRFFDEHPDAGLAGCKILNPNGSIQLPCRRSFPTPWVAFTKVFGLAALFPGSRLFGRYNLTYLSPDETYPVDAVSGSFMMLRREVYETIGGLDEGFFMYGEDLDWCYRVQQSGKKVYYVHSTKIIHFKGESTRRSEIDELKVFYGAMQVFVEKHFGKSSVVKLLLNAGILFRQSVAWVGRMLPPLLHAATDFVLVDCALLLSAYLYFDDFLLFPRNASSVVWFIPSLIVVMSCLCFRRIRQAAIFGPAGKCCGDRRLCGNFRRGLLRKIAGLQPGSRADLRRAQFSACSRLALDRADGLAPQREQGGAQEPVRQQNADCGNRVVRAGGAS